MTSDVAEADSGSHTPSKLNDRTASVGVATASGRSANLHAI